MKFFARLEHANVFGAPWQTPITARGCGYLMNRVLRRESIPSCIEEIRAPADLGAVINLKELEFRREYEKGGVDTPEISKLASASF